ncbi:MAG: YchJ family protein [Nodosilinea sp.]
MGHAPLCSCGSGNAYAACCGPYIAGQAQPPTAEALMRSRYTAFAQRQLDYLIATHHPTQRHPDQRRTLANSLAATTWLGLTVLKTSLGQPADREGMVEFVAYYRDAELGQVHERSRFVQQKDRWFYLNGDQLPPLIPKGNASCWCGSGKKFKACHGR